MPPQCKTTSLQKKLPNSIILNITKNTLSIFFSDNPRFSHKIFTNLLQELTYKLKICSHINSLSLSFVGFCPVPRDLNKILLLIKSIKHLNKFHINRLPAYGDDSLPHFLPFLQRVLQLSKNLRIFDLEITEGEFNLPKINAISLFISHLHFFAPKLTHFKLAYSSIQGDVIEDISPSNFWPIIAKGLKKKIESLTLKLPLSYLLDSNKPDSLSFSPLKKASNLKELSLNLSNQYRYKLHENSSAGLVLQHYFPNLRSFKVLLNERSYAATQALVSMASRIASTLPRIQNISLSLVYMEALSEEETESLCFLLSLGINKLNHLSLLFSFTVFTAQITSSFTSLLLSEKLRILRDLSLNFSRSKSISNFAVEKIGQSIAQNLVNVKRLSLNFSQFLGSRGKQEGFMSEEISNEGLIELGNALIKKPNGFERMMIAIVGSSKVDDEGVRGFCDKIELIENLKRLLLRFSLCKNVTLEAENYIKEKLNHINKEKQE